MSKIFEFIATELATIRDDIRLLTIDLKFAYIENAWYLKSIFGPIVEAGRQVAQYFGSIADEMRGIIQGWKRIFARWTQRLSVASTVVSAIQQEVSEDFIDTLQRWLSRVENSIQNETLRGIVEGLIRYAKQEYEMIADAVEHVVDEYVCEFSSEQTQLTNKRCGFAYELNSQNVQQGLTMRLPISVMQS